MNSIKPGWLADDLKLASERVASFKAPRNAAVEIDIERLAMICVCAWNNVPAGSIKWPDYFPEGSKEAWRRVAAAISDELMGRRLTVGHGTLDAGMQGSNPSASTISPST